MAEENRNEEQEQKSSDDAAAYGIKKSIELRTHQRINQELSGRLLDLQPGYAKVELDTTREMIVDEMGLIHGGYTFAAADFAAMAAVNEPNVVLVSSQCRFLAPVKVGDRVIFEAKELYKETKKRNVYVTGYFEDIKVFEGEFMAVVLDRHVLKLKLVKEEE